MYKTLILLSLLSFAACNGTASKTETASTTEERTEVPKVNDGFQRFLDQFPEASFPIEIKPCDVRTDLKALDTAISSPFHKGGYVYGKFAFGKKRIAVITLEAADCFLPMLTTYDLSGNVIDSKQLAIGKCSDGPCYKCEEILTIRKDLTAYVADTMQAFECDEDDLPKGKPVLTTIVYKEGKINNDGNIVLSEEKEKKF